MDNHMKMDNQYKYPVSNGLSMQEMFMKYPIGTKIGERTVAGYRQTKNESSLIVNKIK